MTLAGRCRAAISDGITFLQSAQLPAGNFIGQASPQLNNFDSYDEHPTIFFSALITQCLHGVSGAENIMIGTSGYLIAQRSADWSWNYWDRSIGPELRRYPDDLDDTCCTLSALLLRQPELVTGELLGQIGRQLIASEALPGGPYTTWLIAATADSVWRDVDTVVNINIARLLHQLKVSVPGLNQYIESAIIEHELQSPYYVSEVPGMYFLASFYNGASKNILQSMTMERLVLAVSEQNALHLALLVSAALQLGTSKARLRPAVELLLRLYTGKSWPAYGLYMEPPKDGKQRYAGSNALTTAFVVQALSYFTNLQLIRKKPTSRAKRIKRTDVLSPGKNFDLQLAYQKIITAVQEKDCDNTIGHAAQVAANVFEINLSQPVLHCLNQASLDGWAAYTVYDDLLDGDTDAALLCAANYAARKSVRAFASITTDADFIQLVHHTFDAMDAANNWELYQARATVTKDRLLINLPDYGDYSQLADRSSGHMLVGCAVLQLGGQSLPGSLQQDFQTYFRHYLIARQLNDDAHDWETDLVRGHISAVVAMLLRSYKPTTGLLRLNLSTEFTGLRIHFWQETIQAVNQAITKQLLLAQSALARCGSIESMATYQALLDSLAVANMRALQERDAAQAFIASFSGAGQSA